MGILLSAALGLRFWKEAFRSPPWFAALTSIAFVSVRSVAQQAGTDKCRAI